MMASETLNQVLSKIQGRSPLEFMKEVKVWHFT
jgi:hypothetical protein